MQKWEYLQINVTPLAASVDFPDGTNVRHDIKKLPITKLLTQLGSVGWEVVGLTAASPSKMFAYENYHFIMKRPCE